jgi:hypothetical protein
MSYLEPRMTRGTASGVTSSFSCAGGYFGKRDVSDDELRRESAWARVYASQQQRTTWPPA